MVFVICCFGEHFAPFLAVCLRSIRDTNPLTPVNVLVDFGPETLDRFRRRHPSIKFEHASEASPRSSERQAVNAPKVAYQTRWVETAPEGEFAIMLDADTIVRQPIEPLLPAAVDFVYTTRPGRIPINCGVVGLRVSPATRAFMRGWRDAVAATYADHDAYDRAIRSAGGVDQYTLLRLMRIPEEGRPVEGPQVIDGLTFFGAPGSVLNQTESVPLSQGAAILHYKGGWRPILLKGRFSRKRPFDISAEMYWFWLDMLREEERMMRHRFLAPRTRIRHTLRAALRRRWWKPARDLATSTGR